MSSSPAQAREIESVHPFFYGEPSGLGASVGTATILPVGDMSGLPDAEALHQQELARSAARQEGRAEAQAEFETTLRAARAGITDALRDFAHKRADYYAQVESEVVGLALNIARHILHRESQIDQFLLAGVVQVALEKIESRTGVTLRVHPAHVAGWKTYFAQNLEPAYVPEIKPDASLDDQRCVIETPLGTADIGIELQLQEIERGFLDLLAQRPKVTT